MPSTKIFFVFFFSYEYFCLGIWFCGMEGREVLHPALPYQPQTTKIRLTSNISHYLSFFFRSLYLSLSLSLSLSLIVSLKRLPITEFIIVIRSQFNSILAFIFFLFCTINCWMNLIFHSSPVEMYLPQVLRGDVQGPNIVFEPKTSTFFSPLFDP